MKIYSQDQFFRLAILDILSESFDSEVIIFDSGFRVYFFYPGNHICQNKNPFEYIENYMFSVPKKLPLVEFKRIIKVKPWLHNHTSVKLSSRESSVIRLLLQGHSYRAISKILGIREKSVSFYKLNALKKKKEKNIYTLQRSISMWNSIDRTENTRSHH